MLLVGPSNVIALPTLTPRAATVAPAPSPGAVIPFPRQNWGHAPFLNGGGSRLRADMQNVPTSRPASGVVGVPVWLPQALPVGACTTHRFADGSTLAVLTPTAEAGGIVADMQARGMGEALPDRCVIGDGGSSRALLGIDKRPGTPLDGWLARIVDEIPDRGDPEAVIRWATQGGIRELLRFPQGNRNDGAPHLVWDQAIQLDLAAVAQAMQGVRQDAVGAPPRPSGQSLPVVPLERYLETGLGYCIQMAVLTSLILERCGVPHRLVQGAVRFTDGTCCGHTWIELGDDRVLDNGRIGPKVPDANGDFGFFGYLRFANQSYPFLVLG